MIKRFNVGERINQYIETGDINVRNEIVTHYMYIVKKVAKFYAEEIGLNVHELESFGYEGLIWAINNCDLNKKKNFNNYITLYIRGYILKGIPSLYGFKGKVLLEAFYEYQKMVENLTGEKLVSNLDLIYDIIELMKQNNALARLKANKEAQLNNIYLTFHDSLNDHKDLIDSYNMEESIELEESNEEFSNVLFETLTSKQLELIQLFYGFKEEYSLNELAEELNYANQHTASEMKRNAITKLRRPKTLARIKAIYTK